MPVKVQVYNQNGEATKELKLSDKVFNLEINNDLIHQAVVTQAANERQVLAHTKTKSEVRGGGKKPWRQKGTGRARAGSSRSPIWIGGGVTFGPRKDRNFSKKINKKMKQKALMMVLTDRLKNNNFIVVDNFKMEEFKTKTFNSFLKKVEDKFVNPENKTKRSVLVVHDAADSKFVSSGRNLVGINIINLDNINLVDLLKNRNLLMDESAITKINERYSKES